MWDMDSSVFCKVHVNIAETVICLNIMCTVLVALSNI